MIILLDGSKGAGKTSVGALLIKEINDASILSLDIERRALPDKEKSRTELNKEAFEIIMRKGISLSIVTLALLAIATLGGAFNQ